MFATGTKLEHALIYTGTSSDHHGIGGVELRPRWVVERRGIPTPKTAAPIAAKPSDIQDTPPAY
jgi:hypothetical protein